MDVGSPAPEVDLRPSFDPPCVGPIPRLTGPIDTHGQLTVALNLLPRPITLPCYLASLPRPLAIQATTSATSLQPAEGRQNPRIFLQTGALIMSISLTGDQSTHIETAEPIGFGMSIKGDLGFPHEAPVLEKEFHAGILDETITRGTPCGVCHAAEMEAKKVDGIPAYQSRALKPARGTVRPRDEVQALAQGCRDSGAETHRCQLLRALFLAPDDVTDLVWNADVGTLSGNP